MSGLPEKLFAQNERQLLPSPIRRFRLLLTLSTLFDCLFSLDIHLHIGAMGGHVEHR